MDEAVRELLDLLVRRADLLAAVDGTPREKPALVEHLNVSRSTVDRAVRELEPAGLLTVNDGIRTTRYGRLCLHVLDTLEDVLAEHQRAGDLLRVLPASAPFPASLLRDATITLPTEATPGWPFERTADLVRSADVVYGLSCALTRPRLRELFHQRVVADGLELEIVYSDLLVDDVLPRRSDQLGEMATHGFRAYAVPSLPFELLVGDGPDQPRAVVTVYDRNGRLVGTLVNDCPAAIRAALDIYSWYRDRAIDITPALRVD